jgi:hypothetical protein
MGGSPGESSWTFGGGCTITLKDLNNHTKQTKQAEPKKAQESQTKTNEFNFEGLKF